MISSIETALIEKAAAAMNRAHAPYSCFRVGAAVLTAEGQIVTGCNVENASYGLTVCAERNAVCAAVASGARTIRKIAIVTGSTIPDWPCGACRQVLAEFGSDRMTIIAATMGPNRKVRRSTLGKLLPERFSLKSL